MSDDATQYDRILRFLIETLTTPQREVLVEILDRIRADRLRGLPASADRYTFEGTSKPQAMRALLSTGYLESHSPYSRFPLVRLTEVGLLVAKELYADMGLDANILHQSETFHPTSPDTRPWGQMTADPIAFTDGVLRESDFSRGASRYWLCPVCDDGERITDRTDHWAWHMRLAATIYAIDWANPVSSTRE